MKRTPLLFLLLALSVVLLFLADIAVGSVPIPLREVAAALLGGTCDPATSYIVLGFRLPKALVALFVGASLSAAGLQMQTLFRNPMAGPFVLGISSGASLGVALFLLGMPLLGITTQGTLWAAMGITGAAWIGSSAVLALIMAVGRRIKDIMVLLILGIMFGSVATALVEILQYLSPEGALKSYVVWTMGSLGGVTASQLAVLLPALSAGLFISVACIKPLNVLLLGDSYARTMGIDMRRTQTVLFLSTVLLAGTATAYCGPIGFIGLAMPHVARILFADADHRILMPGSMLTGAAVLLACDIVSQLPGRDMTLPINTVTALVGIPIVVAVVIRNRKIF